MNFSTPWLKNSWLKSLGLKGPGLKRGVEKSRDWDVLHLGKYSIVLKLHNLGHPNVTLLKIKLLVCRSLSLFSVQTVTLVTHDIFSNFSCGFLNPPKFFQSNLWLSDLLDLKNLQDYFKKAFYYKKVFWPFTVWITYSSDLKFFSITRTIFFSQWVRTILVTKYRSHRSFLHKMMNYVDCELIHQ